MNREQFGDWGKSLSEPDFWRAVAILGAAQFGVDLANEHAAGRHLLWSLPEPIPLSLSAGFCLDVWLKLAQTQWPRLALLNFYDDQAEINENFLAHAAASLYLNVPFRSPGLLWRWPMRVGFLTDPASREIYADLLEERAQHETLKTLTALSTVEEKNVFELLVIPAEIKDARALLFRSPATVRAHCLIVFSEWQEAFSYVGRLAPYTNSAGVLFRPGCFSPREWFRDFVWNLSHDLPIDEADRTGVLFANSDLLEQARISHFLHDTTERLIQGGDRNVAIPDALASELNIPWGSGRSDEIGHQLRDRLVNNPQSIFNKESRGATWCVQLHQASITVRETASQSTDQRGAKAVPQEQPGARFLQVDIPEPLRPNLTTSIAVFIDAPRDGSVVADYEFPDKFSDHEEGHLLTVVFSEPRLLAEPLVETLYLPRAGASTEALFDIETGPDFKVLEARITVLYENRILQTSLLRAGAGESPTLRVEMNVRPGLRGLDQQRRFDAAILLNHTEDGEPRATAGAGYNFATFSLQGLDKTIEQVEGRINSTLWADDEYKTLEAQGSMELVRFLARRGATLYREFLRYAPDPDRLQKATHIQIVAREHASRLPIEFFYARTPPLPNAYLCSNWRQALDTSTCAENCKDDESIICPRGFWCLSRVIEWHRFDVKMANQTEGRAFALRDVQPGEREKSLPVLSSAVMGASANVDKVVKDSVQIVRDKLQQNFPAAFAIASDWKDWARQVQRYSPSVLFLIPHTDEDEDQIPTMEISNDTLASENISRDHVLGPKGVPPVVLLFGCNTDNKGLPHESFVPYFADYQAAIVISSISKVLGRHAAPLARDLIERLLAVPRHGDRSFGEVLRELRCRSLLEGPPVALVLKAYGDADWRI